MKLLQFERWLKSSPRKMPYCVLTCHAGHSKYSMEIEYKQRLQVLKDNKNNLLHFNSIEQAQNLLRQLGIHVMILRLIDPYDEFVLDNKTASYNQDMAVHF